MKVKNIVYLTSFFAILILAIFVSMQDSYNKKDLSAIAFPELLNSFDEINKIEFTSSTDNYQISKKRDDWFINDNSFPANKKKINDFLFKVSELKLIEKKNL